MVCLLLLIFLFVCLFFSFFSVVNIVYLFFNVIMLLVVEMLQGIPTTYVSMEKLEKIFILIPLLSGAIHM